MSLSRALREEIQDGYDESLEYDADGFSDLQRELYFAVCEGDIELVKRALDKGVDPHFSDREGDYVIHIAAERSVEILSVLVYFGAALDVQDRWGNTPLHFAPEHSPDMMRVLLQAGCDVNKCDNSGMTALGQACKSRYTTVDRVQMLLDWGCSVDTKDRRKLTALHHIAANDGILSKTSDMCAVKLLNAGLSAAALDLDGRSALCCAISRLRWCQDPTTMFPVLKTLLNAGSCMNLEKNIKHGDEDMNIFRMFVRQVSSETLDTLLQMAEPFLSLSDTKILHRIAVKEHLDERICERLRLRTRQASSLLDLSRVKIREMLNGKVYKYYSDLLKEEELPMPRQLLNYLCFNT